MTLKEGIEEEIEHWINNYGNPAIQEIARLEIEDFAQALTDYLTQHLKEYVEIDTDLLIEIFRKKSDYSLELGYQSNTLIQAITQKNPIRVREGR